MRQIDMQTWSRREHFHKFNSFDHPHFGMCADVDLTSFYQFVKRNDISINVAIIYIISRVSNEIPEFRHRIRGENVVEHEIVHPSATILTDDELFTFCPFEYVEEFSKFSASALEMIAYRKKHLTLKDEPGKDNSLFMSLIPWVSFTSFTHPMHLDPPDSVPRFAWGKFYKEGKVMKMPLDVQVHHALMDGIHLGKFFSEVQKYFNEPELGLGEV